MTSNIKATKNDIAARLNGLPTKVLEEVYLGLLARTCRESAIVIEMTENILAGRIGWDGVEEIVDAA